MNLFDITGFQEFVTHENFKPDEYILVSLADYRYQLKRSYNLEFVDEFLYIAHITDAIDEFFKRNIADHIDANAIYIIKMKAKDFWSIDFKYLGTDLSERNKEIAILFNRGEVIYQEDEINSELKEFYYEVYGDPAYFG